MALLYHKVYTTIGFQFVGWKETTICFKRIWLKTMNHKLIFYSTTRLKIKVSRPRLLIGWFLLVYKSYLQSHQTKYNEWEKIYSLYPSRVQGLYSLHKDLCIGFLFCWMEDKTNNFKRLWIKEWFFILPTTAYIGKHEASMWTVK